MLNFHLNISKSQHQAMEQAFNKARKRGDHKTMNRLLAIFAISEGETNLSKIARLLRVSHEAVRQWLIKYLLEGVSGLIQRKQPPGRQAKLTKTQRQELASLIDAGPEAAGFPGACWRTPMIQELIYERFGVLYKVHYLSELLKNMGFSYQKAAFSVGGKDPENKNKRQLWLKETWPEILQQAESQNAYLLFGDEASFPQWGSLTYTWARRGKQPEVPTSGIRKGYKVFGLIDYFTGRFFYKTHEGRFNSESYQSFLWEVLKKTRKPIILIQDGARYHTSKATKLFFQQVTSRLTVYQLPAYSPDFNPIEKLWKNVKEKEIHLHYFPTFESLKQKVEEALVHFSDLHNDVLKLFGFYHERKAA